MIKDIERFYKDKNKIDDLRIEEIIIFLDKNKKK